MKKEVLHDLMQSLEEIQKSAAEHPHVSRHIAEAQLKLTEYHDKIDSGNPQYSKGNEQTALDIVALELGRAIEIDTDQKIVTLAQEIRVKLASIKNIKLVSD